MPSETHHTPEELLEVAHLLRLYCTDESGSREARHRMRHAADLIENFVTAIRPMVAEIEAAIAALNQAMDQDQALSELPADGIGRGH